MQQVKLDEVKLRANRGGAIGRETLLGLIKRQTETETETEGEAEMEREPLY